MLIAAAIADSVSVKPSRIECPINSFIDESTWHGAFLVVYTRPSCLLRAHPFDLWIVGSQWTNRFQKSMLRIAWGPDYSFIRTTTVSSFNELVLLEQLNKQLVLELLMHPHPRGVAHEKEVVARVRSSGVGDSCRHRSEHGGRTS
ncbi:hypothetical protein AMTR_s00008p00159260 [Amborella trichopoda]|uniref:Uncharacterized protein n=1 Tax=Amborella trichopoda TaxID=13333 RepID=W1NIQ0_AMBTC|nr:hypothetical protein AMTR_s00008p00159260 [Amborella trichopoda]